MCFEMFPPYEHSQRASTHFYFMESRYQNIFSTKFIEQYAQERSGILKRQQKNGRIYLGKIFKKTPVQIVV